MEGVIIVKNELKVNPEVLQEYIRNANVNLEVIQDKIKSIELILEGKKNPTFNQLSTLSKIINVPTGLLILDNVMPQIEEKLDFRTINSKSLDDMSNELKDTIKEMRVKQEFLKEEIEYELDFIGKYSISNNYMNVANDIREYLELPSNYIIESQRKPFEYFREKISAIGIFVFLNGKIKDNTHRNLNIEEFRGLVLSDKSAPIIFLNQKDSKRGQLFSLIHELVHLFIGNDEIYNIIELEDYNYDEVERFVNKVTAEILAPEKLFRHYISKEINLDNLSKIFPVSQFVLVRRLLDLRYISKKEYQEKIEELEKILEQRPKETKSSGGNYHNNLKFRTDKNFFKYVDNAIKRDEISYTDAFSILGVGYKGYKVLEGREE